MANKLFGTADSTLVAAAFKHGASNIPMDLSGVYKQREQNVKDFATGINEMFDKIYADDKATNDLLTDVSAKSLNLMESGGTVNEYALTAHNSVINDYKEKLKSITSEYGMGKGGDLERSKLRSEMNSYLANMEKSGGILTELKKNSANNVLLSDVGDQKKELLTLIIQDENNGTSITKPEYIKGDIYYTLPGTDTKMTMQELAEGFSVKNPALLSNINKKLTNFLAKGKASGKAMTQEDALRFTNEIKASMSNMDEIRNVGQERFGNMKYSFEEVLTGRGKDVNDNIDTSVLEIVYNELEKLGGADLDNDGDIDGDDKRLLAQAKKDGTYISNENGYTLVDAIKKDKQLYRDVMANYITETAARDFYGQGTDQFKPKGGGGGGGDDAALFTPNTWIKLGGEDKSVSSADAQGIVDAIKTGTSFPFMDNQYDYVNGGWYQNYEDGDNEESDNYYGSPEMLRLNILKTNDRRFTNLITEKENKVDAATGKTVSDVASKTLETSFEDFQQDEYDFTTNIESKYDLSNFRVQDSKTKVQEELGFGESMLNHISIYDLQGNLVYSTRTNFSNSKKAADAAKDFNKFLINNNIKLKSPTTTSTTSKADELLNKYAK